MYLHLYQQSSYRGEAKIICNKKAAAELICLLVEAISTKEQQQATLACNDGESYCFKVKINNNMRDDDNVKLPVLPHKEESDNDEIPF